MHLKKLMKKGITPVIATVLLIVLTLVGGGVVAYFTIPAAKSVDSSCLEAIGKISFENVDFSCRLIDEFNSIRREALEGFSVRISDSSVIGFQVGFQDDGSADTYRITSGATHNALCVLGSDFNQPLSVPPAGGVQTYVVKGAHEKIYLAPILTSGKSCFTEARKEIVIGTSCADPAVRTSMLECYSEQGQPRCGDGNVDPPGEQCDTNSVACTAAFSYPGTRACNADCKLAPTCVPTGKCGDNIINGNEDCDGIDAAVCQASGGVCSQSCRCEQIGGVSWDKGRVNDGEPAGLTIQGTNIGGELIEVLIYEDDLIGDDFMEVLRENYGTQPLHMSWTAKWICDLIEGLCGEPEYYAIARLARATSVSARSGILHVNAPSAACGNGVIESGLGEDCEPPENACVPPYGNSCGYCSPGTCRLITLPGSYCGDGVRNLLYGSSGGESCDRADLGGHSCTTLGQGFTQGNLSCTNSCTFDTQGCSTSSTPPNYGSEVCGNGIQEDPEECDDGNQENGDACTNQCILAACGDSFVWFGTEVCDPAGSVCTVPGGSSGTVGSGFIGGNAAASSNTEGVCSADCRQCTG